MPKNGPSPQHPSTPDIKFNIKFDIEDILIFKLILSMI